MHDFDLSPLDFLLRGGGGGATQENPRSQTIANLKDFHPVLTGLVSKFKLFLCPKSYISQEKFDKQV